MKISNIIALSGILAVSYAMYAMQRPEAGESSAMGAARGASKREIPRLERIAAESIARQIHDDKKTSFMLNGEETRLNEFPEPMRELVAEAYYRLYLFDYPVQKINGDCNSIKALPDGSFVSAIRYNQESDDRSVEHWRLQDDGKFGVVQTITTVDRAVSIAVSSDGNLLAVGHTVPIRLYQRDAHDNFVLLQNDILPGGADQSYLSKKALYNGPSTKTIVVTYRLNDWRRMLDIYSWNNRNNSFERIQSIDVGTWYSSINFDGTGDRFIAVAPEILEIWTRNHNAGMFEREVSHPENIRSATLSPDGRYIVQWDYDGTLIIKSITPQGSITELQNIPLGFVYDLKFSADSRRFALATDSEVQIWENSNNNFKRVFTVPGKAFNVALVGEDYLVSYSDDQKSLKIFQLSNPSVEKVWDHILNYFDMPELEEPAHDTLENLSSLEAEAAPAALSPEQELQAIVAQKKAIKADQSLTPARKQNRLNALRGRERELKKQCQQQGTCGIQ